MAYPATPKTWVAGDVLTAAQLNAELRDALLGAFPLGPPDVAWTGWTPTLTQGVTVTKTVTYAKYARVGRLIVTNAVLAVTGAGTAGQKVTSTLPVVPSLANFVTGTFWISDTSAASNYTGVGFVETSSTIAGMANAMAGPLGISSFTAALAAGDTVGFSAIYESLT